MNYRFSWNSGKSTTYFFLLSGGLAAGASLLVLQGIRAQNECAKYQEQWEAQKIDLDRTLGEGGRIPVSVLIRRGIGLCFLFFPLVVFSFPSYYFGGLRELWVRLLVWTLERSGALQITPLAKS